MNLERETLYRIKEAALEKNKLDPYLETDQWKLGPETTSIYRLTPEQQQRIDSLLAPASRKLMRVSPAIEALNNKPTVIGGLCSSATGDNNADTPFYKFLRMDQITEAVGITSLPTLIVIEDDYFARLRGAPLPELKKQAQDAEKRMQRWAKVSMGKPLDLTVMLTSDPKITQGLTELVKYVANDVLRNPNFARLSRAPILLMYTQYWPELLASLQRINSGNTVCLEPVNHFNDNGGFSRTLPQLQKAYQDFIYWLRNNPPGLPGANKQFLAAGFLEAIEGDQTKRTTRDLPYDLVPNTLNWQEWTNKLKVESSRFPFPLKGNILFSEAINWLLWDEEAVEILNTLATLESEYKAEKKRAKEKNNKEILRMREQNEPVNDLVDSFQQNSQRRQAGYQEKSQRLMNALSAKISGVLQEVLG